MKKQSNSLTKLLEQPKTSAQNAPKHQTIHVLSKKQHTRTTYCNPDNSQATPSASSKVSKASATQLITRSAEPTDLSKKVSTASRFVFAMT